MQIPVLISYGVKEFSWHFRESDQVKSLNWIQTDIHYYVSKMHWRIQTKK